MSWEQMIDAAEARASKQGEGKLRWSYTRGSAAGPHFPMLTHCLACAPALGWSRHLSPGTSRALGQNMPLGITLTTMLLHLNYLCFIYKESRLTSNTLRSLTTQPRAALNYLTFLCRVPRCLDYRCAAPQLV